MPGDHRLTLVVAERNVRLGEGADEEPLVDDHVRSIAAAVLDEASRVQLMDCRAIPYDERAPTGLIVADWLANHHVGRLNAACDLDQLQDELSRESGLPTRTQSPERPHLAAAGSAARWLDRQVAGVNAPIVKKASDWPWAWAQAEQWRSVFRREDAR